MAAGAKKKSQKKTNKKESVPGNIAALHEKSAATRERLLNTAEELFIERGYDGVSIGDISSAAKATKGHIYYYFKNKQELFDAVLERYFASYVEAFDGVAAGEAGKAGMRERLHSAADAYQDLVERNPGYPRLVQREVCSRSNNIGQIARGLEPLYEWTRSAMGGLLPEEGPRSVRHFFMSFIGIVINYYTYAPMLEDMWGIDPMDEAELADRREHVHVILDLLIDKFIQDSPVEKNR